jgi:hypothetical protein
MLDVRQLTQLPERAEDVCSLIAGFAEDWTGRSAAAAGAAGIERELAAAEQRLGGPLPIALRWLYTAYGAEDTPLGTQDRLLTLGGLAVDGEGVVTVIEENQQCAAWGYRPLADEARQDDPAVLWKDLQGLTEDADTWQAYQPRLSVFLLEAAINAAMLAENALTVHRELDSADEPDLSAASPLAIPEHVFWADPSAAPVRWYALDDVLIRNDGGTWLWALARTKDGLQRLRSALPGDWEPFEG